MSRLGGLLYMPTEPSLPFTSPFFIFRFLWILPHSLLSSCDLLYISLSRSFKSMSSTSSSNNEAPIFNVEMIAEEHSKRLCNVSTLRKVTDDKRFKDLHSLICAYKSSDKKLKGTEQFNLHMNTMFWQVQGVLDESDADERITCFENLANKIKEVKDSLPPMVNDEDPEGTPKLSDLIRCLDKCSEWNLLLPIGKIVNRVDVITETGPESKISIRMRYADPWFGRATGSPEEIEYSKADAFSSHVLANTKGLPLSTDLQKELVSKLSVGTRNYSLYSAFYRFLGKSVLSIEEMKTVGPFLKLMREGISCLVHVVRL